MEIQTKISHTLIDSNVTWFSLSQAIFRFTEHKNLI